MELSDLFPLSTEYNSRGFLSVAGHDLAALANRWGTPLYIYNSRTIQHQVASLRGLLNDQYPGKSEITYAAKAYFSLGFGCKLAALGIGVDVVSLGELAIAQKAGFKPGQIHQHGNNKSEAELIAGLELGLQAIVVDSLEELDFLEQLAGRLQKPGRVWLRAMPGITVDTHQYTQTAHPATKFGLPIQDGQCGSAIRQLSRSRWLSLTGLHFHLGSQFFEAEPYQLAIVRLVEMAEKENYIPRELSPGGGWGVPYNTQSQSNDPLPWMDTICNSVRREFDRRSWRLPKLIVEPGRWIAARAGVAVYAVGTSKTGADGTHFLAIDGGMADNIRPALYQAQYTALPVEESKSGPLEKFSLVGKFCETGDILIHEVELPALKRGDFLAVPVSGAYNLSMASNYNLAPRPAVLWLEEGTVEVLQKRERPEESGWWVGE